VRAGRDPGRAAGGDSPRWAWTPRSGRACGRAVERGDEAHDIDAFVACSDEEYESDQPAHPDRAFKGPEQVRQNWSAVFKGVGDFLSELVATPATRESEWSGSRSRGTHADGTVLDIAGDIVCGVPRGG
jgi:hypothetical protein